MRAVRLIQFKPDEREGHFDVTLSLADSRGRTASDILVYCESEKLGRSNLILIKKGRLQFPDRGEIAKLAVVPQEPMARRLRPDEIVKNSEPSVSLIKGPSGSGSGFLIEPGLLVTNAHVVARDPIHTYQVRFPSAKIGEQGPYTPSLLFEDKSIDLAVLAVQSSLAPLKLSKSLKSHKGEEVIAIGSPGYDSSILKNAVTRGLLSGRIKQNGHWFDQLHMTVNPGQSGGPLLDAFGRVVGVIQSKALKEDQISFSVPSKAVADALAKAKRANEREKAETASRHRLEVVMPRLLFVSELHAASLRSARYPSLTAKLYSTLSAALRSVETNVFRPVRGEFNAAIDDPVVPKQIQTVLKWMHSNCISMGQFVGRSHRHSRTSRASEARRLVAKHDEYKKRLLSAAARAGIAYSLKYGRSGSFGKAFNYNFTVTIPR